jgi:hypothetical protein
MNDAMAATEVFNTELETAGVLKGCSGLRPSRAGQK